MIIQFKTKKLERICSSYTLMKKEYGERGAQKLTQRLQELEAFSSIEELVQFRIGRCHPLDHNRYGQFAMDLNHPYRLIFTRREPDGVLIIEIVDYH